MAKARKGLIISLLTLIIAIVVTTSSTYAWFAMNTEVNATNMQITATSDTTYLVIQTDAELDNGKMANNDHATLALVASEAEVLPTAVKTSGTPAAPVLTNGVPTWQKGIGTSFTNGTAKAALADIDTSVEDIDDYVIEYTFNIGLNPAVSQFNATNLKLSSLTVTNSHATGHEDTNDVFFKPMSVLVVAFDGTNYYSDSYVNAGESSITLDNEGAVTVSNKVLAPTVNKDGTPIKIHVYVYINGEHANVTTQNAIAANLGVYTCSLGFTVERGTGA